jgi:ribonucleoside-diphosphate reductase alpha chain
LKSAQTCNLSSINVSTLKDQKDLENRVWAATLIGTLQATYDNFDYISENWQENQQDERLLGVSLTGICDIDYTKFDWHKASEHSAKVNEEFAEKLGINKASRITCIKPEGTASCVMGTASGIHARHAKYYIRRIRYNKQEPIAQYLIQHHPELVEEEEFNPLNIVVALPQKSPADSIVREEETAIDTLERVRFFNEHWVTPGHRSGPNQHNVSCTISVRPNEWNRVGKWMWENRSVYSGIAVLPYSDAIYKQAPFEECDEETYNTMMKNLKSIDLTKVVEIEDNTNLLGELACAGGACEVTFG